MDHDGYITAEDLVAASRAGVTITPHNTLAKPASAKAASVRGGNSTPTAAASVADSSNAELNALADSVTAVMHEVVHEALGTELTLAEAAAMPGCRWMRPTRVGSAWQR